MSNRARLRPVAAFVLWGAASAFAPAVVAQTTTPAPAAPRAGSNGIGTAGSLDHNAGTATSTVEGVHGGTAPIGAGRPATPGAAGRMESDPALGGGSHPSQETPARQR